jgi:predicted MFS family arabinose efflux permease
LSTAQISRDTRFLGRPVLLAMISCHVAGLFFLPLMPLLLGALALDFSLTSVGLGAIGSLQLGCTALGAIFLARSGVRYSCRTLVICAIGVECLVNMGCILSESIATIAVLRALSGFAQGMLLSGASSGAAISRKTERLFVYYNVALAIFAVAGLAVGAWVIDDYGYSAGFALVAVVDLLALALIYWGFPEFKIEQSRQHSEVVAVSPASTNRKTLFALVLFGAALAGSQAFIGRLGEWHGGSIQIIGGFLAGGWCLAIVTPFLIAPLVRQLGGVMTLVAAYFFVTACAIALSLTQTLPYFLVAAALFTPAALLVEPLQFGVLGAIDRSGHLAALGPAAISIGSGTGPILAGVAVMFWGPGSVGVFAAVLFLLSVIMIFPRALNSYRIRSV